MTSNATAGLGLRPEAGDDAGLVVAPHTAKWRPLGLGQVTIDGGFWGDRQQLNAAAMIPHVDYWLSKLGWTGNFAAAVEGRLPRDRAGREFSDSEIYKLLEGMAWEIGRTGSPELEARFKELSEQVAAAQEPDGYLNTMFGRPGQGARYSDLEWGHELYCYGHLIQAGVARARTKGLDDPFVQVCINAADHVCDVFGPNGDQRVPGHPEIEMALVELSRVTGNPKYLDQAKLFIDRRGHGVLHEIDFGAQYFQDNVPVRDAKVFDGHAVRALYLAAGAVDEAVEHNDQELLGDIAQQNLATLAKRTYLTGGMGAHHEGESFGDDYELPPDRSYSETCAAIASVMLNHRLLMQTQDPRNADAIERALYNVVAASPTADGKGFFYTNTLQQRTPGTVPPIDEPSARAASSLRAPFYAVSCCPTNLTRTFASLAAYLATQDDHGVQIHQYAPSTIDTKLANGPVRLRVVTDYPDDGRIEVRALTAPDDWQLTVRVPAWADGATITAADGIRPARPGYVTVAGPKTGQSVVLDLPMAARWTTADPRVDAVRGQVAVERGPIVYALESVDLGTDVAQAVVSTDQPPREQDGQVLVPVATINLDHDSSWPYHGPTELPTKDADNSPRLVPLVPYHAWANRGPSTMRVWIPTR